MYFKFSKRDILKVKRSQKFNFNVTFYLAQYIQNIMI